MIDLHVHSTASDGTYPPAQLVSLAAASHLSAMALTDHDTLGGIKQAQLAAAGHDLELIPGIELSCVYQDTEIHLLGLYVDIHDPSFCQKIQSLLAIRSRRNEEMLERFCQDGFLLTKEDLHKGHSDTVITRAHFARALVEKGYAKSLASAFSRYLQYGGKYCIRKEKISPRQAMELLTANHCFPALAHPMLYHLSWAQIRALAGELKELGLAGLEIYHSAHHRGQIRKLKEIAAAFDLIPTGGSDFHGANKPDLQLGTGYGNLNLPDEMLDKIKESLAKSGNLSPD